MPEGNEPTPNAPAFQPSDLITLAQENTTLKNQLQTVTAERDGLQQKVADLEVTVNSSKEAELQQQLDAARAENEALKAEKTALTTERQTETRSKALEGKVSDVNLALLRLGSDDKYLDKDGNVLVDQLLADYPALAPAGVAGPSAPDAGGGSQLTAASGTISLEQAVATGDDAAINAAFDAALNPAK